VSDIDRYLDELFDRLAGQGATGRRMLEEATDHLRIAAADKIGAGVPAERAEREAVAQFGESGHIAGLLNRVHHRTRLATAASGATLVAGWALLMLSGSYLATASGLAVWGSSAPIMYQTAAIGGLMLLAGGTVLLARRLAAHTGRMPQTNPPYALLGAAMLALAGVVTFVDVPLAVGLLLEQTGLWRHAAAFTTCLVAANCLSIGAVQFAAPLRAEQREAAACTIGHERPRDAC
jgi:hypothetical protein